MTILPHHEAAASMWGQGGRAYDDISFAVSDALAHAAQRLNAGAGQRILDVATGTGWSARNAARRGAQVTAVDIAPELLAAAAELSAYVRPTIAFRQADAERLPFDDASFDGVISTFGVMFAANQDRAAAELGRVCRRGGRLAVAAWAPGGAVAEFFGVIARHAGAPPPAASPLAWGDPAHAERLLGRRLGALVRARREPRLPRERRGHLELVRAWLRSASSSSRRASIRTTSGRSTRTWTPITATTRPRAGCSTCGASIWSSGASGARPRALRRARDLE